MANPNDNLASKLTMSSIYPDDRLFGIYLGKVEYNIDPMQLGRVRVRIPALDGPPSLTKTEQLLWATSALSAFGGGSDYGSFAVPPIGSFVWVMFNGGYPDYPVVVGVATVAPVSEREILRDSNKDYPLGSISMSPSKEQPVKTPPVNEAPVESLNMVNNNPEVYTVFKSPKGASIIIQDRDEVEKMSITDRAGQGLIMSSPVTRGNNVNNEWGRKTQTSEGGDGLPAEVLKDRQGSIKLVDVGGQIIELYTVADGSSEDTENVKNYHGKIRISSRQPDTVTKGTSKITRSGNNETDGKNAVVLELSGSDGKFTIEMQNDAEINTLINIDAKAGTISLETPLHVKLKAAEIKLEGDVNITGNLLVNGTQVNNHNLLVMGQILNNPPDVLEFEGTSNPVI